VGEDWEYLVVWAPPTPPDMPISFHHTGVIQHSPRT
jgi:hypothetical protein